MPAQHHLFIPQLLQEFGQLQDVLVVFVVHAREAGSVTSSSAWAAGKGISQLTCPARRRCDCWPSSTQLAVGLQHLQLTRLRAELVLELADCVQLLVLEVGTLELTNCKGACLFRLDKLGAVAQSSAASQRSIPQVLTPPARPLLVAPVSNSKSEARRTAQVGRSESIGELEPINSDSSVVFRRVSQGRGS